MKTFRKGQIILLLTVISALLFTSCQNSQEKYLAITPSAKILALTVWNSLLNVPVLDLMTPNNEEWLPYVENRYHMDGTRIIDGAILYPSGANASEIAVLRFETKEEASNAQVLFEEYAQLRSDAYAGYAPDQSAMAAEAKAVSHETYCALFILIDPEEAVEIFRQCFTENAPSLLLPSVQEETGVPSSLATSDPTNSADSDHDATVPKQSGEQTSNETQNNDTQQTSDTDPSFDPSTGQSGESPTDPNVSNIDDSIYDGEAVLAALLASDPEGLSLKSKAVYDLVNETIANFITEDMSDFEKEHVIHDYIIMNSAYDMDTVSASPYATPDPDNDNPYGVLIKGESICFGYASSFQLFMDVLGIECITVIGKGHRTEEHCWNMVRLDGEWYCVDVGWDDPVSMRGDVLGHDYLNVTSLYMKTTQHSWDEDVVPDATATKYRFSGECENS
ncbi:MAG: DUF4358 domain-containing protein [Lachnospiraceae bacterium]|jgi:hypothetical protein|nr:DUF4358 domain-containing protein [Lachnospiraceae bacterium]